MLKWFTLINRYGQWCLAVIMLLFIISGYGMTAGIMDRDLARKLHIDILPIPLFLLMLIHLYLPFRSKLTEWRLFKTQRSADVFSYAILLAFLILFLWLYFR